ncbi:hypothetical protein FC19_GL002008 [Liquorilactobacillus aquaticus DSM 21051]|uniref:Uncharacterized protein n=1 Tax=Liquorilactobacillus aquaticus DSM 21051 TaxID=1423725 RepID=A0A0R2D0I4_9LACO|nr:hypothetical protein [Liquorilactobacillus aquaticus]KRM95396.1 hypothetical protein FC19_GL002008 [Liquorilactobacillus aquaticus DSM 21051]
MKTLVLMLLLFILVLAAAIIYFMFFRTKIIKKRLAKKLFRRLNNLSDDELRQISVSDENSDEKKIAQKIILERQRYLVSEVERFYLDRTRYKK